MDNPQLKVIVLKSKNYKWFIGFSTNPKEFIDKWLSNRSQYCGLQEVTATHFTAINEEETVHFYVTSIRDGESFMVSLNDNCMGFNDFH